MQAGLHVAPPEDVELAVDDEELDIAEELDVLEDTVDTEAAALLEAPPAPAGPVVRSTVLEHAVRGSVAARNDAIVRGSVIESIAVTGLHCVCPAGEPDSRTERRQVAGVIRMRAARARARTGRDSRTAIICMTSARQCQSLILCCIFPSSTLRPFRRSGDLESSSTRTPP